MSTQAHAGGFYIQEQSTRQLGSAFAGAAADPTDASTVYSNPAGITELRGKQFRADAQLIRVDAKLKNSGSEASTPGTGNTLIPFAGADSGNPYDLAVVPAMFLTTPLSGGWSAGLGINAPFGLANRYTPDFFGRYDSLETSLYTINVQPTLAYKVSPQFSIGGGPNIQYAKARLKNAIPSPVTAGGPVAGTDGLLDLVGDGVSYGYTAGILYQPVAQWRLGLSYRSAMRNTLDGRVIVRNPIDIGGAVSVEGAEAKLNLPDITNLSVAYDATPKLTLLAQTEFFSWSRFEDIPVTTDSGTFSSTAQHYKDTLNVSLGAKYAYTDATTLRVGYQYDPTPTQDNYRNTRTPDGDRQWFTAGLSYQLSDDMVLDTAAAYLKTSDESINLTRNFPTGDTTLTGTTESSAALFSLGLTYRF